ncbi:MAG: leucine-rich repeat domain-containing protein, partial [Ruminococcus sp.]|nr:leucine-rich repeat domain-containing protein [Ruminococcus sp.]
MKKYGKIISGAIAAVMAFGGAGAFNAVADNTDGAELVSESRNIELPPIPVDNEIASGTCGNDLKWILRESGTLTVSGTGEMADYFSTMSNPAQAPWLGYKDKIKTVIIGLGVTYIGESAFENCTAIESVTVNDTVKALGEGCFSGCSSLKELPEMNGVALISR